MLDGDRVRALLGPNAGLTEGEINQLANDANRLAAALMGFIPEIGVTDSDSSAALKLVSATALEEVEERIAIRQYDGEMPQDSAERLTILEYVERQQAK